MLICLYVDGLTILDGDFVHELFGGPSKFTLMDRLMAPEVELYATQFGPSLAHYLYSFQTSWVNMSHFDRHH